MKVWYLCSCSVILVIHVYIARVRKVWYLCSCSVILEEKSNMSSVGRSPSIILRKDVTDKVRFNPNPSQYNYNIRIVYGALTMLILTMLILTMLILTILIRTHASVV